MRRTVLPLLCAAGVLGGFGAASPTQAVAAQRVVPPAAHRSTRRQHAAAAAAKVHSFYSNQVVILMYHGLSLTPTAHGDYITPRAFAAEITAMRRAGLRFVTLAQIADFLSGKGALPHNAVALTFDDGLESVYTYAYPILQQNHVPFACFLIGGRIGRDPADLSWGQIQAMGRSGLASFGSHTMDSHGSVPVGPGETGPALVSHIYDAASGRTETDAAFRARILHDLQTSRTLIAMETHQAVTWFAYPFGAYSPEVEQLLRTAGYRDAVTTWGWGTTMAARPLALPRINAGTPNYSGGTIVSTVLYIARLTAHQPKLQPPPSDVPVWH